VLAYVEDHRKAVGTDGYLLTKTGAQKLLRFIARDGLFSHVDLRMLAYCLPPEVTESDSAYVGAGKSILRFRRITKPAHRLTGYSMTPSITKRTTQNASTRIIEDEAGKAVAFSEPVETVT
jgi:GR25 family glycosyltransferase involved in LPS biosynthesis